jgi:hypothetical protein
MRRADPPVAIGERFGTIHGLLAALLLSGNCGEPYSLRDRGSAALPFRDATAARSFP